MLCTAGAGAFKNIDLHSDLPNHCLLIQYRCYGQVGKFYRYSTICSAASAANERYI
nr:hypothetical protein [Escherichia coli]